MNRQQFAGSLEWPIGKAQDIYLNAQEGNAGKLTTGRVLLSYPPQSA